MRNARFEEAGPPVHFIVPGSLQTLTGGFIYDRQMVCGLTEAGRLGAVHELAGDFPRAAPYDVAAGAAILSGLPDRSICVIDGLALTALGQAVAQHAGRLDIVAMIHHPLADETGLGPMEREAFFQAESAVLEDVSRIIVSSSRTARRLGDFGVNPSMVHVVEPGIADWAREGHWGGGASGKLRLLSVGTLVPRKGHDAALRALAECADLDWHLDIAGAVRDEAHGAALAALARQLGLEARVSFHGEVEDGHLLELHRSAGLFLSASHYEGFGMAVADAVGYGMPVLTTHEAAVSDSVRQAAELVPAGDEAALALTLRRLIADPAERTVLAERSRGASRGLSNWRIAAAAFERAVDGMVLQ